MITDFLKILCQIDSLRRRLVFPLVFTMALCFGSSLPALSHSRSDSSLQNTIETQEQDTIQNPNLYNGRVWRNLYPMVRGNQFLFSDDFLPGTVTINNKRFDNLYMRYDIYNDEVMIKTPGGIVLQINKEMVNSFTLDFEKKTYSFLKLEKGQYELDGYVSVLYLGKVSLFVKYTKKILPLEVEKKFDLFEQSHRMYLRKENSIYQVNRKKDILVLFENSKQQIRSFIKTNKIYVSKNYPERCIPLVEFCDHLSP